VVFLPFFFLAKRVIILLAPLFLKFFIHDGNSYMVCIPLNPPHPEFYPQFRKT
jgi:hypothetical protein